MYNTNTAATTTTSNAKAEAPKTSMRKKLVIIGDGAVGKTCLIQSFFKNNFSSEYETTVFETHVTNIQVESNDIELMIWVRKRVCRGERSKIILFLKVFS